MEPRASTLLGQNVKLLTYVSIFYLPLVFCAIRIFPISPTFSLRFSHYANASKQSIWSTSDTFGYPNLVCTMVNIGVPN
ncbi:uncharacterized protein K444DRAFT_618424 [Hyaloscypha bicolor E]|uniref:Uncharacterized protein n=1 Tax=Hyaloscypha bicolor E TaxID=1095630 RepID=A0A2J6ST59_9HELO|nr:uncharacterized protein K444DRAFT_618424 [Hyaloscypha bicolor E]PMD53965.1 hypothetical protein K444DRAFT_618424 [Hyaloscypha bicolor E]